MVADSAAADVSVTVDAETISMQVCQYAGDEATRAATVAVYAHVLHTKVTRRTSREHTWIEARGTAAGHPVHVWTVADPQRVR
jgi:glycerophosphoryl diester phosphodiesterase